MTRPALLTAPLRTVALALFPLLLGFFAAGDVHAHATGENYVWVNVESSHVEGRFEIRLDDLRERLGVDVPADATTTSAAPAIEASAATVHSYLREHFSIKASGQTVPYDFTGTGVTEDAPGLGLFAQYFYHLLGFLNQKSE